MIVEEKTKTMDINKLKRKAIILDELVEFIEDKYLGYLMNVSEEEKDIPLSNL